MSEPVYPTRDGRVFFDLARDRLASQLESLDAIDAKVGTLFATSTALLGILAAVLVLRVPRPLAHWTYATVVASVGVYVFLSACAWSAYRVREWNNGPELRSVWRTYSESEESDTLLEWAAGNKLRKHYEDNKADVDEKLEALAWIFRLLVTQSLILVGLTLGLAA